MSPPATVWPTPGTEENCTDTVDLEVLTNLMTGATDKEIGRLLMSTGLVKYDDGNLDKQVDRKDRRGVHANNGLSSVFDFNADGITDAADLQIAEENFGKVCMP